jgi:hypothetical protein
MEIDARVEDLAVEDFFRAFSNVDRSWAAVEDMSELKQFTSRAAKSALTELSHLKFGLGDCSSFNASAEQVFSRSE